MKSLQKIIQALEQTLKHIEQQEIQQKQAEENKKLQKICNEHYTSYNRNFYLKYRPEDEYLILETIRCFIDQNKSNMDNYKLKRLLNLQYKLEKHHIYWKLENK